MRNITIIITLFFTCFSAYCTSIQRISKYNFGIDNVKNNSPIGWTNNKRYFEHYIFSLDSVHCVNGKYSISIESNNNKAGLGSWSFVIPNNYQGNEITLSGYIKTENVEGGYAGLWLRIDPNVALANMQVQNINGTTSWSKYCIKLPLRPDVTEQIIIGGMLQGTGKVWFDNFAVTIDGQSIDNLIPIVNNYPARRDTEFNDGSAIDKIRLSKQNLETIKQLCRIWGFLKYYHPAVRKGQYNFDFELFRILPRVLNVSKTIRDKRLALWIDNLGEFDETTKIVTTVDSIVYIQPDLSWINIKNISTELVEKLMTVKNANRDNRSYYVSQTIRGNPKFDNEHSYSNMKYSDTGFRLLALYRYWNIIQYYFPYKDLIGEDWSIVLENCIPDFIYARSKHEYTVALLKMIVRIKMTLMLFCTPHQL